MGLVVTGAGELNRLVNAHVARYSENMNTLNSRPWKFILKLLTAYKEGIEGTMHGGPEDGAVLAKGGYPTFHFDIYAQDFHTGGSKWAPLSLWTVAERVDPGFWYGDQSQGGLKEIWEANKNSMNIWSDTHKASNSIIINIQEGTAGIIDSTVLDYVNLVEKGGAGTWGGDAKVPARPLFAAANAFFMAVVRAELANGNSPLRRDIMKELRAAKMWTTGKL